MADESENQPEEPQTEAPEETAETHAVEEEHAEPQKKEEVKRSVSVSEPPVTPPPDTPEAPSPDPPEAPSVEPPAASASDHAAAPDPAVADNASPDQPVAPATPDQPVAPATPAPPTPQQARRVSTEQKKDRMVSVDQDTFVPPRRSMNAPRSSMSPGGKRLSGDAYKVGESPSTMRKSKFGGLSSKARMVLGSIVDIKSNVAETYDKKNAKYQNTYRLESENPFNPEKVDKIIREIMTEVLENLHYDPDKCASTAKQASVLIRSRVKQLEFDRYKLVCIVTIGEKNSQDVYATCRFLWDAEKDRYSFYSLENTHVYAIAYCFGLYYE